MDSDCNPSAKLECVGGLCNETCLTDADCGPNQVCYTTTRENASGNKVKLCYFKNFEPTSLSSPAPSSGSAWQLPANGGKSQLCIPEGPTAGAGGAAGAPCAKNSDCISHTCAAGENLNRLCTSRDTNCKCRAVFTWSGAFWGRTECSNPNMTTNKLTCQTGNCGTANGLEGNLDCNPTTLVGPFGPANPVLQGEYTLEVPPKGSYNIGAQDFYDNSGVNGFNVGYSTLPVPGTFAPAYKPDTPKQCGPAGAVTVDALGNPTEYCSFDLLDTCPDNLKYKDSSSMVVGCWAPTQACLDATDPQKMALGCTKQVPFLCATASDCPYNAGGMQKMTCGIQPDQAFGQCECEADADCPSGFTCSGSPGRCVNSAAGDTPRAQLGPICSAASIFTTFLPTTETLLARKIPA